MSLGMIIPNTSLPNHIFELFARWAEEQGLTISQAVRKIICDAMAAKFGEEAVRKPERPKKVKAGKPERPKKVKVERPKRVRPEPTVLARLVLCTGPGQGVEALRRCLEEASRAGLTPIDSHATALGRKAYGVPGVEVRLTHRELGLLRAIAQHVTKMRLTATVLSRVGSFDAYLDERVRAMQLTQPTAKSIASSPSRP